MKPIILYTKNKVNTLPEDLPTHHQCWVFESSLEFQGGK